MNFFHCRLEDGKPQFDEWGTNVRSSKVYVRPHSLEIEREGGKNSFRALVKLINSAGPLVRIEVVNDVGDPIQVEMAQERYQKLKIQKGEFVFVTPKEVKVFNEDFSI